MGDGDATSPSSEMVLTFETSWTTTGPSSDKDALQEKFRQEFTKYMKEEDLKKAIETDDMKSKYGNFTVMKIESAVDGVVNTPTNSPTSKTGKKSKTKKTSKTQAPTASPPATKSKSKAGKNKTGKTIPTSAPTAAKGNKGTKTKVGKGKGLKIANIFG